MMLISISGKIKSFRRQIDFKYYFCGIFFKVFQSKVLQKLYPVSSTLRKEHSPPLSAEAKAKTSSVNRKACGQDTVGKTTLAL